MLSRIVAVSAAVALVVTGVFTGVASAGEPSRNADLRATATFGKASYDASERVVVTITITNIGREPAEKVRADTTPDSTFFSISWGAISPWGPGARIAAGETLVVEVTGSATPDAQSLLLRGQITTYSFDSNVSNNAIEATAGLTYGTGTVAYTLYADENGNGQADEGEGFPGVEITLTGGPHYRQTTGPDGTAVFTDILAGRYMVGYAWMDGWVFPDHSNVVLAPDQRLDVAREGVRFLSETLAATIEFDQDSYAVGDVVHLTVTLANSGADLPAVHAYCGYDGATYNLFNDNAAWGGLAYDGAGVPVAAGTTEVVHVTVPLTPGAEAHGFIRASCSFHRVFDLGTGTPGGFDQALITGGVPVATG